MLPKQTFRVGYVLKRYPRYSETFIVNEILAHEAAGLDIEIFSLRPPDDNHFQDVISQVRAPVTYLPVYGVKAADLWVAIESAAQYMPGLWSALEEAKGEDAHDVYQALVLARAVCARGISHLHAHFGSVATTVSRLASLFSGVPYSFTAHAKDIFHESVRHDELTRKIADASSVVTVSDYNACFLHDLCSRSGTSANHLVRIYNGLDLDRFPYTEPSERAPLVLGVGRLVEKKGFSDLVDACAILAARGTEFSCRIIGTGELEESLRAQISSLGLQSRVELLGSRPQCDVIREVRNAAVFAAPCVVGADGNRDGLPTVLLEAMSLGTPCISTDVTGIPEVLRHEETGLMVPQRDPHALADAIERLIEDRRLRVALAERALRKIEVDFSIHRNTARMRDHFGVPAAELRLAGGVR